MKRFILVGLKPCPRCHRAVAYVMTEDGEHSFGIALDAIKTREISRRCKNSGQEKFLTDLVIQLLASSCSALRKIVLDWDEEGFLFARVDAGGELFSCSAQDGVAIAAAAGSPLYATERVLGLKHLLHSTSSVVKNVDLVQPKPKPTLH
ncbi:MAG TPA: hypothetical protein VNL14_11940 [Candidatus Acidoferrales bacterium]|nr:hypothetical protein [Candidatus Acidoferrales bacterium]